MLSNKDQGPKHMIGSLQIGRYMELIGCLEQVIKKKANGVASKICRVSFGSSFEVPCEQ
jgi:hypothetical protein